MSHTQHIVTPWLARVLPPESGRQAGPRASICKAGLPNAMGVGRDGSGIRRRNRGGSCGGVQSRGRGRVCSRSMVGGKEGVLLAMIPREFGSMWDVDVEA